MFKQALIVGSLMFSGVSLAHNVLVFPEFFNVNNPKAVAIDATATHGLFRIEKPVSADAISVYGPDGKSVRDIGTVIKGLTRTSFELPITEEGTYKVVYGSGEAGYMTSYTIGARDTNKRLRGVNKTQAQSQVPADAKNVQTIRMARTSVAFITNKLPTDTVFKPAGKGLELVPITHPADYINGEEIALQVVMDGKPLKGAEIKFEAEASQYRASEEPTVITTDDKGEASITLEEAGRYIATVSFNGQSNDPEADMDMFSVFYPFEVIYE